MLWDRCRPGSDVLLFYRNHYLSTYYDICSYGYRYWLYGALWSWYSKKFIYIYIYIIVIININIDTYTHIYIYMYVLSSIELYIYIFFFYGSSRSVCWILDRAFQSQFTITVDCYELGVSQKRRRVDCYQRMYWSDRIGLNMVLKNRFNGGRMIYSIAWFPALLTEYFNSNWTFKVDFGEMIIS